MIDDQPFEWIADGDSRLGPVLEAIVNGRYYWIPFQNIGEIVFEEPSDLRDVVWTPAYFTWANGGESPALIPTRYPGSETSEDDQVRMSRKTEWDEREGEVYLGQGQRMLMTDTGEYPLMDVRKISVGKETAAGE
jgi:type VI secretion system protein ImpE